MEKIFQDLNDFERKSAIRNVQKLNTCKPV